MWFVRHLPIFKHNRQPTKNNQRLCMIHPPATHIENHFFWKKHRVIYVVSEQNFSPCCGGQINIPVPANFWNISDWQRIRQEWQNKDVASIGQTLLWRIVNRKKRTANNRRDRMLIIGAGLDSWYKTGIRWIGGRWCWTGFRWCRKRVAGSGLVVAGVCWCRKVVAGSGLVVAGVCWCWKVVAGSGLVIAGAGKWWLLVSDGAGKWTLVSAGVGRWSLVQEGGH